jgi:hypothetical protein
MPTESLPLRDIHLPLPVGIWPLATGWWFLIAALIAVIAIVLHLIQRHRRPTALKQALAEVDRLFGTSEISNVQRNQEISLILKKLAVTTYPREDVAGLSGQEWIKWVRSQLEGGTLSAQLLDFLKLGPYSSKENVIQDQDVFRTEIHALLIAVGSSKVSLISKWLEHLPFLKSKKTT